MLHLIVLHFQITVTVDSCHFRVQVILLLWKQWSLFSSQFSFSGVGVGFQDKSSFMGFVRLLVSPLPEQWLATAVLPTSDSQDGEWMVAGASRSGCFSWPHPRIFLSVLLPRLQEDDAPVLAWLGGMFLVQVQCWCSCVWSSCPSS